MSQQLDSEHFDICRICLRRPETNRSIVFLDIFKPLNDGKTLKEYIKDLFDLNVEPNDQKLRKICEVCYISIVNINETKKKAFESAIIINHLVSKNNVGSTYHRKFVCSNSDMLKIISPNKDATIKNESKCIQKIESSEHNPLDGGDATDPNEPRYCLCDQIAFGNMIACDHKACVTEWFHYGCVGIMKPPKGKWYCPKCRNKVKQLESLKKKATQNIMN